VKYTVPNPFFGIHHIELGTDDRSTLAETLANLFGGSHAPTSSRTAEMVNLPFGIFELKAEGGRIALLTLGNERVKHFLSERKIEADFSKMKKAGGPILFTVAGINFHSYTSLDGVVVTLKLPTRLYMPECVDQKALAAEQLLEVIAKKTAWACKWTGDVGLVIQNPTIDHVEPYGLHIRLPEEKDDDYVAAIRNYCQEPLQRICSLCGINIEEVPVIIV
jgi:hypothetical protein